MDQIIQSPRVRHQSKLRLVQVAHVEQPTPRVRRITLSGGELEGFTSLGPDDHVKLFFPAPGQDRPTLPVLREGRPVYPNDAARPPVRDYTPRRFDPQRCELVIEFVLHGHGPASSWAKQAKPGQWIGVGGPKSSRLVTDNCDLHLLAGDESALPAIARHLEEMQAGARALVLIEVADAHEERYLPTAANAAITWLFRDGVAAGRSDLLEVALRNLTLPLGTVHAWIAAELDTARRLRDHLRDEEGLAREQIRAAGYWRLGEAGAHASLEN